VRIDIDALTEAELIDLNNRIVERLRFLNQMRAHGQMLQFKIGDRVSFQPRPADRGGHAHPLQPQDSYRHHRQRPALECRADATALGRQLGRVAKPRPQRDPVPQDVIRSGGLRGRHGAIGRSNGFGALVFIGCTGRYAIPALCMPDAKRSSVSRVPAKGMHGLKGGRWNPGPVTGTAPAFYH